MKISSDDVNKIAHLARLQITADDIPEYSSSLSTIFDFVEQMEQADTDSVVPMAHPLDMTQRLRDDQVTESTDQREQLLQNAPATEDGLFLVPRVIE